MKFLNKANVVKLKGSKVKVWPLNAGWLPDVVQKGELLVMLRVELGHMLGE